MAATQMQIAQELGLDVSTVNKCLNRTNGPKFRKETIQKVFRKAKELGYQQSSASKGQMRRTLEDLFPKDTVNGTLVILRGVDRAQVIKIKRMLYGEPDFKL